MTRKTIDLRTVGAKQTQVSAMLQTIQSQDGEVAWTDRLAAGEKPGNRKPTEA